MTMTDTKPVDIADEALTVLAEAGGIAAIMGVDPANLRIGVDLAKARRSAGALGEALGLYATLALMDMNEPDYQLGLADVAFEMGEYALCVQAACCYVAQRPMRPEGYFLSGAACLALGQIAEAREDLEDALRFAKEQRNAKIFERADRLIKILDETAN